MHTAVPRSGVTYNLGVGHASGEEATLRDAGFDFARRYTHIPDTCHGARGADLADDKDMVMGKKCGCMPFCRA